MGHSAKYEEDFYAWTQEQATALRAAAETRTNLPLDWENLAEEIESMGRSDLRSLIGFLGRVIEHLLKLELSPAADPRNGWMESVDNHRIEARRLIKMSPSLKPKLAGALDDAWEEGRRLALRGLGRDGLGDGDLPAACPYTAEQVLDLDFFPVNRHGLS